MSESEALARFGRLSAALERVLLPIFTEVEEQAAIIAQLQDQLARVTEERDGLDALLKAALARLENE